MNDKQLLAAMNRLQDMMRSVSTGGGTIEHMNSRYRSLWLNVDAELSRRAIENPNEFTDLWQWYGRWSSGDLPSYASRRTYIAELYAPLTRMIHNTRAGTRADLEEPTGWARVDRTIDEMRRQLAQARTEEQLQQVGLLAREALISLGQAVYDPERHVPSDGVQPSATDAKRMLDAFISGELPGQDNEVRRRHVKASVDLAMEVQHQRTATFRDAALCAEATTSVVNSLAILSGRRDPMPERRSQSKVTRDSKEAVRALIQSLNEFAGEEMELRNHPGAGPTIFFVGDPGDRQGP